MLNEHVSSNFPMGVPRGTALALVLALLTPGQRERFLWAIRVHDAVSAAEPAWKEPRDADA